MTFEEAVEKYLATLKNEEEKDSCQAFLMDCYMPIVKKEAEKHKLWPLELKKIRENETEWIILADSIDTVLDVDSAQLNQSKNDMEENEYTKRKAYQYIKAFYNFIEKKCNSRLKIQNLFYQGRILENKIERQLDIIKKLQETPMTKDELADYYCVTRKSIDRDIDELQIDGLQLLGQKVKLKVEYRLSQKGEANTRSQELYYSSTAHPIFLPLNMTQVYAMTAGLKKLARGSEYESILNHIADWVYSQLTEYAKDIIQNSIDRQGERISFKEVKPEFREERKMFSNNIREELVFLEKSQKKAVIHYKNPDTGLKEVAIGYMEILDPNKIGVYQNNEYILIKIDWIEKLDYTY